MKDDMFRTAIRLRNEINILDNLELLMSEVGLESLKVGGTVRIKDPSRDRYVPREVILTPLIIQELLLEVKVLKEERILEFRRLGEEE